MSSFKYIIIIAILFFTSTVNARTLEKDVEYLDNIIARYWDYSDIQDRGKVATISALMDMENKDEKGILQEYKLYEITYCYYLENISAIKHKQLEPCSIGAPEKEEGGKIKNVSKLRNNFSKEVLKLVENKYNGEIAKVSESMPLPRAVLKDKTMRLIKVKDLIERKPVEYVNEESVLHITVNHLLNKYRSIARSSDIFILPGKVNSNKKKKDEEVGKFILNIDKDVVSKVVLDLRNLKAADLSMVMYFISQFVWNESSNPGVNKSVALVEYIPANSSRNTHRVRYKTTYFAGETGYYIIANVTENFSEIHEIGFNESPLADKPMEILIGRGTTGYGELIPLILRTLRADVKVTGASSGSLSAELTMGEEATGIADTEFIFSAGDILVNIGEKSLTNHRFTKVEGN